MSQPPDPAASPDFLALALAHVGDAVVVVDPDMRVQYWGPAAETLYGVSAQTVQGQRLDAVYRYLWDRPEDERAAFEALERDGMWRGENTHELRNGERRRVDSTVRVMRDAAGHAIGMLAVIRDVTERERARTAELRSRHELQESETRLALALEAGHIGIWEYDPARDQMTWSPACERLLEAVDGAPRRHADLLALLNDEDRAGAEAAMRRALDPADGQYRVEYRVRLRDGALRWLAAQARAELAGGRATRLIGALVDVTPHKRAEALLREESQRKSEFLAVLSHELRTPLAAISNAIALIECLPPGDKTLRAQQVIRRQATQLERLVDDLLDVSRIDHGKIELVRELLDAREIVRRVCDDARAAYEHRGVELGIAPASDAVWVEADAARLAQMVGNLLTNALKFTSPGGRVSVGVRAVADRCEIRVSDTGVGLAADELPHIFAPFAQAARTQRQSHGLGIGLALVRQLAALHGGTTVASSEGPGRGAEFVISLPSAKAPPKPAEAVRRSTSTRGLSILIVEDNEDAAQTLADLLSLGGHSTRIARDGEEALTAVAEASPDVLLCDVGLPDMTGYDLIATLRREHRGLYAVALTGYAQPSDKQRALDAGFDAHLSKPPPLDELERNLMRASAADG